MYLNKLLLIISLLLNSPSFFAQDLETLRWKNRILVLEAEDDNNPDLLEQINVFRKLKPEFEDRKLLIFKNTNEGCNQLEWESLRAFQARSWNCGRIKRDGFQVKLIGLDGSVKLARTRPLKPAKIFELIDRMPMRKAELRTKN